MGGADLLWRCNLSTNSRQQMKIGEVYGRLVVQELLANGQVRCQCGCGQSKIVLAANLRHGHTKSCGCSHSRARTFHEGDVFRRLTIIELLPSKKAKCRCSCKQVVVVLRDSLRSGATQSCGCLQRETIAERSAKGTLARRRNAEQRAREGTPRGWRFIAYARKRATLECIYCGVRRNVDAYRMRDLICWLCVHTRCMFDDDFFFSRPRSSSPAGYVYISMGGHGAEVNRRTSITEHRLVFERFLGRFLDPDEVVHHIDGDRTNNCLSNLRLMSAAQHGKLHAAMHREMRTAA